uniref:Zmp:0000001267 n=1 Tax=Labrus bergylta TaxID=56723 RepID=A0A3Q3G8X2_9LABR
MSWAIATFYNSTTHLADAFIQSDVHQRVTPCMSSFLQRSRYPQTMESDRQGLNLKREVGIVGAVSFIAGTMMGSGIFISPQYVLMTIGSPGASLIIWACCGIIAMLGGLCYAELGTVIPESGGEFIYILRTSGRVLAFTFVFSFVIVMRPASATGIALSFAEYVVAPFYNGCTPPTLVVKCVAAGSILVLAIVNCLSVRLATIIQVVSMAVKVLTMAVIIMGGILPLNHICHWPTIRANQKTVPCR